MKHIRYKDTFYTGEVNANNQLVQVTEIRTSKVYGIYFAQYPSGKKQMVKVWNTRLNKMVAIRADHELVEVID